MNVQNTILLHMIMKRLHYWWLAASHVLHASVIFLMGTVQPVVGLTLTCCEVVQLLQPTFVTAISQWSTCVVKGGKHYVSLHSLTPITRADLCNSMFIPLHFRSCQRDEKRMGLQLFLAVLSLCSRDCPLLTRTSGRASEAERAESLSAEAYKQSVE